LAVGVIASSGLSETSPELSTTVTDAGVPAQTWYWLFVPLGVGTVKVIAVSLQLPTVRVAVLLGAPQFVPLSLKAT
jgi:hypothetical protein